MNIPLWLQAGLWGLLAGGALLIGAMIAWFIKVPVRLIAAVMAFGSGVLISALSFDLMDEAYRKGGIGAAAIGFLIGAALFTGINYLLALKGAKHRKRSGKQQPNESESAGSGLALNVIKLSN